MDYSVLEHYIPQSHWPFVLKIEENIIDDATKLVYSDWLEEQGYDDLAQAWRWVVQTGCLPYRIEVLYWQTLVMEWEFTCEGQYGLPRWLYQAIIDGEKLNAPFQSEYLYFLVFRISKYLHKEKISQQSLWSRIKMLFDLSK